MQYALFKMSDDQFILLDACEQRDIDLHHDSIVDGAKPADDVFELAYGAYLPQPSQADDEALGAAKAASGFWMGTVNGALCDVVGLEDVEFFPAVTIGHSSKIPFAALICINASTRDRIQLDSRRALTCFVRYESQMTPATNVLNRAGIFAIKSLVKRLDAPLTKANWRDQVDSERVLRHASKVF